MDRLNGIVVFVRVAETLSFVAAGRSLGLSASAIGKTIARLEASLGLRLFNRSTRRVSLTQEGALFHDRCRRILDDLGDAEAMLSEAAEMPRGVLRVGLPTIGYRFLLPILPEFHRLHPGIELDLDFNDRIVDLIEQGLDVVIRSGDLTDSGLMSRRLGPFRFVLCASPAYLDRNGIPRTPSDLDRHDCLRFRFPTTGKLQDWAIKSTPNAGFHDGSAMICNNMEALHEAAIRGLGIAYMPDFLARDAVSVGELRTVLDDIMVDEGQFSVLWASNRHLSPKVRAFVDFISTRLFTTRR